MSFYDDASWLLIPSGIEEDVVFAQKPTSGLGDLTFTRASDATYTDSTVEEVIDTLNNQNQFRL